MFGGKCVAKMPLLLLDTCKGTSVKDLNGCLPWPLKSLKHSSPLLSAMSPGLRLGHGRVASTTCHSRRSTVSPLRLPAESDHAKLVFLSCLQRTIKTKKSTKEKISEASACHWLHRWSIDPCPRELVSLFTTEDPRLLHSNSTKKTLRRVKEQEMPPLQRAQVKSLKGQ